MRYSLLVLIGLCLSCQPKYELPETVELSENWQFRKLGDSSWYSATVPGNVFSDLLDNNVIKDPFIANNEAKVQWVSETGWEYRTQFSLSKELLNKTYIDLSFKGLDTYATVYLNDSLILDANNAFRKWNVSTAVLKPLLMEHNEILVVFSPNSKIEEKQKAKLGYQLPEGNRIFTRKAQFQYGWDWGPKLNSLGIWRPINLTFYDKAKISNVSVVQNILNDSIADLTLAFNLISPSDIDPDFHLFVNDSLVEIAEDTMPYDNKYISFQIDNPKRWWPHNLGEPYQYDIKLLIQEGRNILDSITIKKGLRTVDLITEEDSLGESFYFKINDLPVYSKGANYIPQNSFQNEVTKTHYENLLNDVVDANMNMLRVWGGGIYEEDIFYELCDEKGILLWQDFMFACAMYPGDDEFLNNVKEEATQVIVRLKNHASIVLWCGNNENSEGWKRWGWQEGRAEVEKKEIWDNYLKLFDSLLPQIVESHTEVPYWESSPKYGRGNRKYQFEGDAHDWWVWHDAYPFEHFQQEVPRFMSEYGFQSFPSEELAKFILQSDSLDFDSDDFKNHQKHSRGFELIEEYMKRDFPVPDNKEDYIYMSQLLQAYGIAMGAEAHRRAKPYNMGSLYWQLNDCWPAVSWSSIDFFGNWKALHYKLKSVFENVLISSVKEDSNILTYIINDEFNAKNGVLDLKLMDFNGKLIWEKSLGIEVLPNSSKLFHRLDISELTLAEDEVYLVSSFNEHQSLYFLAKPKELKLEKAPIDKSIKKVEGGFEIELSSIVFQKDVFLKTTTQGHFDENFFHLSPNKSKKVFFKSSASSLDNLEILSFNKFIR